MRLHIDGEIVGKKAMSCLFNKDSTFSLVFCGGDDNNVQGYIHNLNVLPLTASIMEYFAKVSSICEHSDSVLDPFNAQFSFLFHLFPCPPKFVYFTHKPIILLGLASTIIY